MTLTWDAGSGSWSDAANWSGTVADQIVLGGSDAYTVTMGMYVGSFAPVTISDPAAVLQMSPGAYLGGVLTLSSGTVQALAAASGTPPSNSALVTVENAGGTIFVAAQAALKIQDELANNGQIYAYGALTLGGTGNTNTGTIAVYGGSFTLADSTDQLANAGTITLAQGGTLDVSQGALVADGAAGVVRFLDQSGAVLKIGGNEGDAFGSTIDRFQASDAIDLVGAHYESGVTMVAYAGGVLTVRDHGSVVGTLSLTNIAAGATFAVANDGHGGTLITTDSVPPAATGTGGDSVGGADGTGDPTAAAGSTRFVDTSIEAQAARLYNAAFGRAPDAAGLAYWSAALHGGASLDDVAGGFLGSTEFLARYGYQSDAGFVTALYQNVLHRAPDASGAAYWDGAFAAGAVTRAQALAEFSESPENEAETPPSADAQEAARLYWAELGRAPDSPGLTFWTGELSDGVATLEQEADALAASPEFVGRYGTLTDTAFVSQLYQNVLGRAADPAGLTAWVSDLAAGASRGSVVVGFTESSEMINRFAAVDGANGIVVT